MQKFEYKVVAAPRVAKKFKGVKDPAERFARTVEELIGEESIKGWEYFRADTLPAHHKAGLMRKAEETYQTLLIFRRAANVLAARKTSPVAEPIPEPKWETPVSGDEPDADETPPKRPSLGAATD